MNPSTHRPRSVLLIISGSIAAYKSLDIIRLLRAESVQVRAILTRGGSEFITPLAVSALTGTPTYEALFSLTDEVEMGHIRLSRSADLVLVAPASADILARMAAGMADDLATTALLATDKPVMVAPAMNHRMWHHPATQRNIAQLIADGVELLPPEEGDMACGEVGIGRMMAPERIVSHLMAKLATPAMPAASRVAALTSQNPALRVLGTAHPLVGKHAVVTSGPTAEAIDPVRYLGNRSSGKQGHAIAAALAAAGAKVTLISGKVALPDPVGVRTVHVSNAAAMLDAVSDALPADIFVAAAAVADWRLATPSPQKLKKQASSRKLTLELVPTVDILSQIGHHANRPALVIGFAAETEKLLDHARKKRREKGCDWLLANSASGGDVFGADENTVTLITAKGEEPWPTLRKEAVAERLVARIAQHFQQKPTKKSKR